MPAPEVILVVGPTACGKSALAMELARQSGGEILSADSMQVYRGMDIGTAKPTAAERHEIPHHLLDVADPHAGGFTVARWLELAREALDGIARRGRLAVVVGGTNLYIKVLTEGLCVMPPADARLREELRGLPPEQLRARLEREDPAAAARIHPRDERRAIRALEVHAATGRSLSSQQGQWSDSTLRLPSGWRLAGLLLPAEENARRINARFAHMMEAGLLREVEALRARGPLCREAAEAAGYRELLAHLDGRLLLQEAVEAAKARTRALARRQRTWLRRFRSAEGSHWLDAGAFDVGAAAAFLRRRLDTSGG